MRYITFRAETDENLQFLPEKIRKIENLNRVSHRYHLSQIRIALHHIIGNGGVGNSGEVTTGTFYFHVFSTAIVQNFVVAVAFGFSNEIDVLDVGAFLEHYCPVGVVVFSRSVDVETTRLFCIGNNFILMFKCLGKVHLDALRIYYYEVVESFLDSMALMLNLPFKADALKTSR